MPYITINKMKDVFFIKDRKHTSKIIEQGNFIASKEWEELDIPITEKVINDLQLTGALNKLTTLMYGFTPVESDGCQILSIKVKPVNIKKGE